MSADPRGGYAETHALVAALEGDVDELERAVRDMLPGERRTFADALRLTLDTVAAVSRG